jgi:hypothetical protein
MKKVFNTTSLPVKVLFEDGICRYCLEEDTYGVTGGKLWALIPHTSLALGTPGSGTAIHDLDDEAV